jgi:hypothetical protein
VGIWTEALDLGFEVEMIILVAIEEAFCFSGVLLCLVEDPSGTGRFDGDGAITDDSRREAFEVVELASGRGVVSICD